VSSAPIQIRGRGAAKNPPNRFERIEVVADLDAYDPDEAGDGAARIHIDRQRYRGKSLGDLAGMTRSTWG
jgi:hypothetical protein